MGPASLAIWPWMVQLIQIKPLKKSTTEVKFLITLGLDSRSTPIVSLIAF